MGAKWWKIVQICAKNELKHLDLKSIAKKKPRTNLSTGIVLTVYLVTRLMPVGKKRTSFMG